MYFSVTHQAEGAPSFAESAVLVFALGAKSLPRAQSRGRVYDVGCPDIFIPDPL